MIVPFDSLLRTTLCALCFLFMILKLSKSESESDDDEMDVNNTRELRILPTPLMLHLNNSTAQLLINEANRAFVSNTSLSDLVSDNETQQMLLRYRERKRQERILSIQREILLKLGLTSGGPNVTARLSAEERQSLVRSFDRTMDDPSNETAACPEDDDDC